MLTGLGKGSRIDYTLCLGSHDHHRYPLEHSGFGPEPYLPHQASTPLHPPPPVIINDVLRLNDLKPAQIKTLHSLLEPLEETVTLCRSLINNISPKEMFGYSEVLFHAIELAAREVTTSTPHVRKPPSKERELTRFLGSDRSAPGFTHRCEH